MRAIREQRRVSAAGKNSVLIYGNEHVSGLKPGNRTKEYVKQVEW